jgi:ABC-type transport system involved in cytochrome c biogenesis permease subunit
MQYLLDLAVKKGPRPRVQWLGMIVVWVAGLFFSVGFTYQGYVSHDPPIFILGEVCFVFAGFMTYLFFGWKKPARLWLVILGILAGMGLLAVFIFSLR